MDENQAAELALKRAEAIVRITNATAVLAESVEGIKRDVAAITSLRRIDQIKLWLLAVAITLSIGIGAVSTFGFFSNRTTLNRINCATDPTGTCSIAKQSQQDLTHAIQHLQDANKYTVVFAVICARQFPGLETTAQVTGYEKCIETGVAAGLKQDGF